MGAGSADAYSTETRFADALASLLRHSSFRDGFAGPAFQQLTETGAAELGIARASVWAFAADGGTLDCVDLYVAGERRHEAGLQIARSSAPEYFRALERRRVIAAHVAATDPASSEFHEGYLRPLGITSLLDAPIVTGGVTVGAVCFEHIGEPRRFAPVEQAFAASLADLAATMLEVERRRAAEDELRAALDAASIGTFRFDAESGRIVWSDTSGPLYGLASGQAPSSLDEWVALVHPEDRDLFSSSIRLGDRGARHERFAVAHRPAGVANAGRHLECRGAVQRDSNGVRLGVRGVIVDVTDRKRLEERVSQVERAELLGRFAGGIAHDVNNVLTAVHGHAARLARWAAADPKAVAEVEGIEAAVDRAASLTRQLLMFANRQAVGPAAVEVDACVVGLSDVLHRLLGPDVSLDARLDARGAWCALEQAQFEQVVINLVVNARDAMPQGGRVVLSTSVTRPGPEDGDLVDRTYVVVSVRDTGTGIAADVLPRIFEPFFSTKAEVAGTGLGLSTCQVICAQAGGAIRVETETGVGSCFRILLPTTDPVRVSGGRSRGSLPPAARARILLAEDEPVLRDLAVRGLVEAGHVVVAVSGAIEGIAALDEAAGQFDILVTDVVLADGSGLELAERFRARDASRPVLFVSGFAPRALERRGVRIEEAEFLEKPFRPIELRLRVEAALRGAAD